MEYLYILYTGMIVLVPIDGKIVAFFSSNKDPLAPLVALDDTDPEDACLEDEGAHPSDKMISHTGVVGGVPRKANVVAGGTSLSAASSCATGKPPAPANRVRTMDETDPASLVPVKVPPTRWDLVQRMDHAITLRSEQRKLYNHQWYPRFSSLKTR
jgi:hypothetical protein